MECKFPSSLQITLQITLQTPPSHPTPPSNNPLTPSPHHRPGTSDAPPTTHDSGATINCNLSGGTRATAATCTGSSHIPGLGRVGSSTTLASTQIDYATLTVTAGREMLARASEAAQQAGESESGGGGEGGGGESSGAAGGVAVGGLSVVLGGMVVGWVGGWGFVEGG